MNENHDNAIPRLEPGFGWKIHLNFDYRNPETIAKVRECLDRIPGITYKIGNGGGIQANQPGKEATVYIGDFQTMQEVAKTVETELGEILLDHKNTTFKSVFGESFESEALTDDIPVSSSGKIMGRFDVSRGSVKGVEFMQYGPTPGISDLKTPELDNFLQPQIWGSGSGSSNIGEVNNVSIISSQTLDAVRENFGDSFSPIGWYQDAVGFRNQIFSNIGSNRIAI